ncbi:MAG TPA: Isoquinoline 1-oxidoreductase subunit [Kofleriaceae bacterium]|nr:Isoquinoline 1-oxidoreductase subunit [Kofleriaceae bacterium]
MRVRPIAAGVIAAACAAWSACSGPAPAPPARPSSSPPAPAAPGQLLPPAAFASIAEPAARSQAIFLEASRVLTHARCVNCHPPDDTPRQGDDHAPHDPPVVRGPGGRGVVAMQCESCHQDRNLPLARVPGAPDWHLAPKQMVWLGRTPAQICAQLSDPERNGGKTLAQIQHHLAHDGLVAWGWDPGHGRSAPPGSQQELGALFQAWIDTGAVCPPDGQPTEGSR